MLFVDYRLVSALTQRAISRVEIRSLFAEAGAICHKRNVVTNSSGHSQYMLM